MEREVNSHSPSTLDDKQFNDALENTIKSLAYRERYGVSNDVLQGLTGVPNVVPAVSDTFVVVVAMPTFTNIPLFSICRYIGGR
jgi:hypothetical protein